MSTEVEFLKHASTAEVLAFVRELDRTDFAADRYSQCRFCPYIAIGNDATELMMDLGRHALARHEPEVAEALELESERAA